MQTLSIAPMTMLAKPSLPGRQRGFSMVEIAITLAILGILAAIALPEYTQYVNRARRVEASTVLRDSQQFMQRLYAANNSYQVNGAAPVLPVPFQTSPPNATRANYLITVVTPTPGTYTLTATRAPGGPMVNDRCGTLTIDQRGTRGVVGSADTVQFCWQQ